MKEVIGLWVLMQRGGENLNRLDLLIWNGSRLSITSRSSIHSLMLTHADIALRKQGRNFGFLVNQLFEEIGGMLQSIRITKVFHDTSGQVVRDDGSDLDFRIGTELPA